MGVGMGKRIGEPLGQALVALARNHKRSNANGKVVNVIQTALWHES
jgi:Ran GTPase-activating protein (RanGAP) involved in mRNA processing and transport